MVCCDSILPLQISLEVRDINLSLESNLFCSTLPTPNCLPAPKYWEGSYSNHHEAATRIGGDNQRKHQIWTEPELLLQASAKNRAPSAPARGCPAPRRRRGEATREDRTLRWRRRPGIGERCRGKLREVAPSAEGKVNGSGHGGEGQRKR